MYTSTAIEGEALQLTSKARNDMISIDIRLDATKLTVWGAFH